MVDFLEKILPILTRFLGICAAEQGGGLLIYYLLFMIYDWELPFAGQRIDAHTIHRHIIYCIRKLLMDYAPCSLFRGIRIQILEFEEEAVLPADSIKGGQAEVLLHGVEFRQQAEIE